MNTNETKQNTLAQTWLSAYESIREMVANLEAAQMADNEEALEAARTVIQEDPLEVTVRSGWHAPGQDSDPEEYCILLSTGGPASRIIGELDQFGNPETARLEVQDWGTPWTDVARDAMASASTLEEWQAIQPTLLAYAREFYFGE